MERRKHRIRAWAPEGLDGDAVTATLEDVPIPISITEDTDKLQESDDRFRALVQHAADLLLTYRYDGTVTYASPSVQRILGYDAEQGTGENVLSYVHPDDRARCLAIAKQLRAAPGTSETIAARVRHADGTWCFLEATCSDLGAVQGLDECVLNARDVTREHALEEHLFEADKLDAIGRLAGGIAHDFNNLLTAISGYGALLADSLDADSPHRSDVDEILAASARATALVQQLLTFARPKEPDLEVLELNEVVQSMAGMTRSVLNDDVTLKLELNSEHGWILADRHQLERVVLNLVVNANDSMSNGGTVTISTEDLVGSNAGGGNEAELIVTDTGAGMDEATVARALEPFFTTKPAGQGTGLGLSTVALIVTEVGGHLTIDSDLGRGTSMRVAFPCADEPAMQQPIAPVVRALRTRGRGRETVLVVDDDEAIRSLACRVLRQRGYTVLDASDGLRAIMVADGHPGPIDLLVTDVVMPNLRGDDIVGRLTASRPCLKVLFMSGYTGNEAVVRRVSRAGRTFLPKPFGPDDLVKCVRDLLDGSTPAQEPAARIPAS